MIERSLWHPVVESERVTADAPRAARLLGIDLVLWRDSAAQVNAWADRCPHRGTKLSLGALIDGPGGLRLECLYHGWQFASNGQCMVIPAVPAFTPPDSHRACTHQAREAQGLVWVRLAPGPSELPTFDGEADPRLRKLLCGPFDVATSAARIVENFLDMAHFGFVHEGSLGDRLHTALTDYRVEPTPHGFKAVGCRAWQPQSHRLSDQGSEVEYTYEVTSPFSAQLTKLPQVQDGYRDVIGLVVCPIEPEFSRVWFRLAVTDHASSDDDLRAFQQRIFAEDCPVLESQSPKRLPLLGEVHCAADRASAAYRRFLREAGISFGVC